MSSESNLARESELYLRNTKLLLTNSVIGFTTEVSEFIAQTFVN